MFDQSIASQSSSGGNDLIDLCISAVISRPADYCKGMCKAVQVAVYSVYSVYSATSIPLCEVGTSQKKVEAEMSCSV